MPALQFTFKFKINLGICIPDLKFKSVSIIYSHNFCCKLFFRGDDFNFILRQNFILNFYKIQFFAIDFFFPVKFKQEIRAGKQVRTAVRTGFKNAMSAILDSNITTLIAGVVLLVYGTGSIQGFAKTLLLGVVVSMFTAIIITRFLLNRFVNAGVTQTSFYTKMKSEKEVEA